jgi:hypothetical protein
MAFRNWLFEQGGPFIVKSCEAISKLVEAQTFSTDGQPYLSRFYLVRKKRPDQDDDAGNGRFSLYLHYFHRGDEDWALHNHPWEFSMSLILTNGYVEERWTPLGIKKYILRPGSINIIRSNDFHRVDLIHPEHGAWTLFLTSRRVQEWGFWHPDMPHFVPWPKFVRKRDHAQQSDQN